MPAYSKNNNASIKFECPKELKRKFYLMCKKRKLSGALFMRMVLEELIEEMELMEE